MREVFQSAYRALHLTETAFLYVLNYIITGSLDSGNVCLLTLLNLSVAFDNIDQVIC